VLWAFVAFLNCFSVGIGQKAPRSNQSMKVLNQGKSV
jgi:hypothetical protein